LSQGAGGNDADADNAQAQQKFTSGTLYAIARELEASASAPPKMTAFGKLTPAGTAGRHQYVFEFPEDHEKHEATAFVPSAPGPNAKVQANNFFACSLHRDIGIGHGALQVFWRMNYESVGNLLKPSKPFVVVCKLIALKNGIPVRAAWPA